MHGVSKKTGQRHPLSSGIWHGAVWRKVELPNHLRAGNFGDTALQRAAEGNGKYYGCSAGFHAEGVDCQRDRSEEAYDEIPPRVEYSLSEKGQSVVPILQSICQWAGLFYKEDTGTTMVQCQKCDHRGKTTE